METEFDSALALAMSAGIGLLVGFERERNPLTKAGLRTFALIAMLGCLTMLVAREVDSGWIVAGAMVLVGGAIIAAHIVDPATKADDSGTTTLVAALLVFALGALIALGHRQLAVGVGVSITVILYFKTELEGFTQKLTPQDLRSMLRFAVLSAVILPLLPDRPLVVSGPLAAVSPYNVWLMVVLISGVSLLGYVAWRLTLGRHGVLVTGVLGGFVSSTATTLAAARHAHDGVESDHSALTVILLANATMLLRVILIVAVVAPAVLLATAAILLPALLLNLPFLIHHWRRETGAGHDEEGAYRNPANLTTAIGFGALYAVVLVLAAWLGEYMGTYGIYGLAAVSGLTDVDAITLSVLRLTASGALPAAHAAAVIAVAVGSNLAIKTVLVYLSGGRPLGNRIALGFLLPFAALAIGVAYNALGR